MLLKSKEVFTIRLPRDDKNIASYIATDIHDRLGNKIAKDMVTYYNKTIRAFYDDYQPHIYKRKYRSYFFAHKSGTKGYAKFSEKLPNGDGFIVSLEITPANIQVPYTSISGGYSSWLNNHVFYNTFVLGQHGDRLPYSVLPKEDQDRIHPRSGWRAYKDIGYAWTPPRMKFPPKKRMDMWFRYYTFRGGIHKTVNKLVVHSINKIMTRHDKLFPKKK